ncbi:outer membrane protein assembly factor BamC [Candidatus Methylospira mobilis]|uniref:Outer membrane protein assembly factor BamC n=1 Tax=Candidatus Methylospira mobilis TaxID=1808979 RepID=A0A5Q0BPC5_9GAMM|nr:outer membrane protein assembly factor BamC [Candidatus Methylospira mobilis]QFY44044.1 outer membrane protein assembly factor BamC [Candidatus Methylospira mobilis]WNV05048.1 outer membrane protein assembly factor BamC [Candidatus Methylospira mobilis]
MDNMKEADQKSMFRTIVALGFMVALTGCSYITDLFPDKQKAYRYSEDIPPLEIPPDLTSSTIKGLPGNGGGARDALASQSNEQIADTSNVKSSELAMPAKRTKAIVAVLAQGDDDVPFVDVAAPFAETWNLVGRAMGRLELEVTEQSRSDRQYFVYFGGEKSGKTNDEQGWWQSLLGGDDSAAPDEKAEQFHVKLEPKDSHTHIYVLDNAGKPVLQGAGLRLLKKLSDTLDGFEKQEFIKSALPGEPQSGATVVSSLKQDDRGAPVVDIQAPAAESWNYVGRALSQMEVKVTDKNRSGQLYFVDYNGKEQEGGAWSSFTTALGGSNEATESFHLKLEPYGGLTRVHVLDASNKPVSDGLGLKLITQLQHGLDELAKPASK